MRLNNLIYRTSKLDAQHVAQTFTWKKEACCRGGNLGFQLQGKIQKIFTAQPTSTGSQGESLQTLLIKFNEQNLSPLKTFNVDDF